MFFKKKKISQERRYKTSFFVWILGWIGVFFLWFFLVGAIWNLDFEVFDFDSQTWSFLSSWSWKASIWWEKSQDEKTTYILLTGRWGWNHDAPDLTDTIILAGVNPEKETITLLSLPRDLWVEYPNSSRKWKINRIYESFLSLGKETAISKLQEKVTEITGKEIDYYMNIDFAGFIEVVDALGWVQVTLEENFVDYSYPDWNLGYKTFILRKGTWTLDGEVALMYARSRHSTSDFDRSLRQQEIISSLKEKAWKLWYLKDAWKVYELYGLFKEYVETDMGITDMVKLWLNLRSWEQSKTLSFNLNDTCYAWSPDCTTWGFLYVPLREYFSWASVLLPNEALAATPSEYWNIQKFSSLVFDNPEIYSNPENITIFNAAWIPLLAGNYASKLRPYGFTIDKSQWTKTLQNKEFENSFLQYNNLDYNNITLQALKDLTGLESNMVPADLKYDTNTKIEIILSGETDF